MITHQLSLKGKAAADVAEVAKHLNITHDVRDAENKGGIAECSHITAYCSPVAQLVEHGVSNAKIMGSIPRESKS